jgi:hypothetical protein
MLEIQINFEEVTKLLFTILMRVSVSTFKINTVCVHFFLLNICIYIYFLMYLYVVIQTKVFFVTVNFQMKTL